MSLTEFGLSRTRFATLMMAALLMAGILLYADFPKRENPEITIRTAVVDVLFPGMAPKKLEDLIGEKVERKIREIKEVDEIKSVLKSGSIRTKVTLKDEVIDLDPVWQTLRDKMDEVQRELPDGTQGPFVNTDFGDVAITTIAMTAEGFSYREMELTAKDLQRELYTVSGVAKVSLSGVQEERIWLELDASRLASIGGQLNTLINDMQTQNTILPAGELNAAGASVLLEATGDFGELDEIRNMLTKIQNSEDFAKLDDLVHVRRGYASPREQPVFYNGRPALILSVLMQPGFDAQDVGRDVKQAVKVFEATSPIGYAFAFPTFQPAEVTAAVNNALSNVGQTFVVVLLVVLGFLGVRSGIVIASIVPFAVMFALVGMRVLDIALEQVSIAAVIISLGLLVDNGVVVVEDILRRVDEGVTRRDAAAQAGAQFAVPLLVSSLTTIFAFTPFFLLPGSDGEFAFSLGAVVTLTLIGSWVSATYFLPLIASKLLRRQKKDEDTEPKSTVLTRFYSATLPLGIRFAPAVMVIGYGLVFLSVQLFPLTSKEMFPASERGEVLIYMDLYKGSHISATEDLVMEVTHWIGDKTINPEVRDQVVYVGSGGPRFYLSLSPNDPDPTRAFFLVNTQNSEDASRFLERANRHFYEEQPEARFTLKRLSMGANESGRVEIGLTGPDHQRLLTLGRQVESIFATQPGLVQNEHDWGDKIVKFVIDVDQDKARRLGLTSQDMAQVLSAYFDGFQISEFREDDQSIPIMLRAGISDRDSLDDLLNIFLPGSANVTIPLEQTAHMYPLLQLSQIRRENQQLRITVTAKSSLLTAGELYDAVKDDLAMLDLSGGYDMEVGGELKDSGETYGKLAKGLPAAFILMIAAVVYQFNSFRRTAVIFLSVPLVIIGVPVGLLASGEPMSFFATLGLISLAGIIINNAIVLIDQIDIDRQDLPLREAVICACGKRLRPILLTSITTVLGLAPLYLFGGALWSPLAIVMMSGLALASILTLYFVPAVYTLMFRNEA